MTTTPKKKTAAASTKEDEAPKPKPIADLRVLAVNVAVLGPNNSGIGIRYDKGTAAVDIPAEDLACIGDHCWVDHGDD